MMTETIFRLTAAALALAAGYCLWQGWPETAFLVAVFGCVAFFFSVRVQTKNRIRERESETIPDDDQETMP